MHPSLAQAGVQSVGLSCVARFSVASEALLRSIEWDDVLVDQMPPCSCGTLLGCWATCGAAQGEVHQQPCQAAGGGQGLEEGSCHLHVQALQG